MGFVKLIPNALKTLHSIAGLSEPMLMKRMLTVVCFLLMVLPLVSMAMPVGHSEEPESEGWWVNTTVDRDGNGIGDMVEKFHDHPLFLDEDNTLPIIVDFDHTPTE